VLALGQITILAPQQVVQVAVAPVIQALQEHLEQQVKVILGAMELAEVLIAAVVAVVLVALEITLPVATVKESEVQEEPGHLHLYPGHL
jgi:hypothetical protein